MKTKITFFIFTIILIFCNSCNQNTVKTNSDTLTGTISVSGAFALYPLTVQWAENFKLLHPDVTIDISAGGAGKGMADVLSGMVDLAMFSREVTSEEENKGAWKIPVAKDAVFPTVNTSNPLYEEIKKQGLTREQCMEIFTVSKKGTWDNYITTDKKIPVNVYTRSDACGAASMWAKFFGKEQEDLTGTGVYGDPGIADAVKNDKYGIGFNNLIYVYDMKTNKTIDGVSVIPLDLNGNRVIDSDENFYGTMTEVVSAIQSDKYPSPPARELYLISKGKPVNPVVVAFLKYILNEGQQVISTAGYVELDSIKIDNARQRLE